MELKYNTELVEVLLKQKRSSAWSVRGMTDGMRETINHLAKENNISVADLIYNLVIEALEANHANNQE
jgi:hypothetical protein